MNKPRKNEVMIDDKRIDLDEFPNPIECGDSDEEITEFVDRYFDACVKHDVNEHEAMRLMDAHFEQLDEPQKPKIDLTPFYASADNVPHEFEAVGVTSEAETAKFVDEFFEDVEKRNAFMRKTGGKTGI